MNCRLFKSTLLAVVLGMSQLATQAAQQVEYVIDEVTTTTINVSFTPNDEVAGYAACLFQAGTAEQQFQMFGAWMGFSSMGDMVKAWGFQATGPATQSWTGQEPGTDYDILVQSWDADGNYGDLMTINVTTLKRGGEGQAEIDITIGEFGSETSEDADGVEQTTYYQWVTFTPNDQVSVFHDMLLAADAYATDEWGEQGVLDYLKTPQEVYWWNQYTVDSDRWTVSPAKRYYAFAIGQNVNDEWGPLAVEEFTTPGTTTGIADLQQESRRRVTMYDLTGRPADGRAMMRGGVFIINGHKVVIK